MMKKIALLFTILFFAAAVHAQTQADAGRAKLAVEVEAGPVWQSRNDVQIPNTDQGTRFSLVDLAGKGPNFGARVYVTWNINERHGLRFLAAPLIFDENGMLDIPVRFEGEEFDARTPTSAAYKFNSWRATYRYRIYGGDSWNWWIGFTAKIRDAKIRLEQSGRKAEKTDLGFVPLASVRGEYNFARRWQIALDADALAGGPGRAVDASLKCSYKLSDHWKLSGGYRTIEGGADVEEVYNFAWLHYAVFSAEYGF